MHGLAKRNAKDVECSPRLPLFFNDKALYKQSNERSIPAASAIIRNCEEWSELWRFGPQASLAVFKDGSKGSVLRLSRKQLPTTRLRNVLLSTHFSPSFASLSDE